MAKQRDQPYLALVCGLAKLAVRPLIAGLAVLYFLIDALVLSLVRPAAARLAGLPPFVAIARGVASLGRYPTLALFLIPLIVLEPVKPIGLYLIATKRVIAGTAFIAIGELLKVFLLERLFHMGRAKLMTIPAFAWTYLRVMRWLAYLQSLPAWQAVRRAVARVKEQARRIVRALRRV
jgi:hypothetical protein